MLDPKCRICRRLGQKLFLKGERCLTPKCAMVKRSYPPGLPPKKRRKTSLSEYGRQLAEKQKLRRWYGLDEKQFSRYIKKALGHQRENQALFLIKKLEKRLDNVVFRLGLANSRTQARQLISHGHFSVNGKLVDRPGYEIKKNDKISVRPTSINKIIFKNLSQSIKKYQPPAWLELNKEKLEGIIKSEPNIDEIKPPVEISAVLEFYSR